MKAETKQTTIKGKHVFIKVMVSFRLDGYTTEVTEYPTSAEYNTLGFGIAFRWHAPYPVASGSCGGSKLS